MSDRTFAILDPFAGVSGDMLLGAILDAGAPVEWLQGLPARLGLPDVSVGVESVDRSGVRCTRVSVVSGGASEGPGQGHGHVHGHHGPHRHVGELLERIAQAPLSDAVRERAMAAFRLLGEAEGRVHGVPAEQVHLHEVGAWDALVDVVGACEGFERLGVEAVYVRPLALGDGWVHAAHGHLPVPAPATAILVEGLDIRPNGPVRGEAVTPTGAALLRTLSSGALPARWTPLRTGWGAGTRNPEGYPNALRLTVARAAPEAAYVSVLATDLDDMSPEYLEPLREALLEAGALDVQVWVTQMKKGRVGFRVEALVAPGREERVADACFRHSSTAGVRWTRAERVALARSQREVTLGGDTVRVKVVESPGGPRLKPEYDDVARVARATGRPVAVVAAEALDAAQHTAHKESA
jgi:uncharacterized protein (TIGR00299 family) protein